MNRKKIAAIVVALLGATAAHADGLPVVDVAANTSLAAQLMEDVKATADRAMDYAQQLAQYAELVNTYANAVENTVAIPAQAVARVEGLYYRAEGIATTAATIAGGEGTMMQRARGLRGLSRNTGQLPGDSGRTLAALRDQMSRQLDDNTRLLGLEDERKAINAEMLGTAQTNSADAVGRMTAIQTQSQVTASAAAQLQQTNALLQQQIYVQMVKDAAAQADDDLYQQQRTADIAALRDMAANPARLNQSLAKW